MTKKRRKLVVLTSLMALLLTLFPIEPLQEFVLAAQVKAPTTINGFNNKCGYNPSVDGDIPTHVRPCSDNGFKFNSEYYYQTWKISDHSQDVIGQRHLIVYGDVSKVDGNIQSFKKGMQDADANVFPNKGHFSKSSGSKKEFGEYRFLGYDVSGTLYPNDHFIRDSNDYTLQPVDKRWIYQPWKSLPGSYKYKPGSPGGVYRDREHNDPELDKIKTNIDRSIGFRFADAPRISYADRDRILSSENKDYTDVRNFMNIGQEPTVWEPGIGMMYHWHPTKKALFYQSFPLLQQTPNEKKPTIAACEIVPVSKKPIALGKSQFVEVEVQVTGILKDESYINKRDRETEFYTRKDIDYWKLDLTNPTSKKIESRLSSKKADGVIITKNKASHVFSIKVDTEKLDRTNKDVWTLTSNAAVSVYYANHSDIDPSYARETCQLNLKFQPNPHSSMKSDFHVLPEHRLEQRSELTADMLDYIDYSYGEDADYYEFVITNTHDKSKKATKTFDPAIPEVKKPNKGYLDQEAVNRFLQQFMYDQLPAETMRDQALIRTFSISQTIIDKDKTTNNRSTETKEVTVMLMPNTPAWSCDMLPDIPQYITPNVDWELHWYDVVPFPTTEGAPNMIPTDQCGNVTANYSDFTKRVTVDDVPIDANAFFKGEYIFGEDKLGLRKVSAYFNAPDGTESHITQYVVIHESKPRVSLKLEGLYKQNRTMQAFDRSKESNDQWAEERDPLEITSFSYVKLDDPNLKIREGYGENNKAEKMFIYKETGNYQMSIAAKRVIRYGNGKSITRVSDPYLVDYEILPDHRPAIIAHTYSEQTSRLDELPLFYDVQSTDGDFIDTKKLQVFYDSKQDGSFTKKMFESDGDVDNLPVFDQLGQYKIVVDAKEGTKQERLEEFITDKDNKTHHYEAFFTVDNYAPFSHMYFDTPVEMPEMDVYFMLDKNLKQDSIDYIRGNRVTLTNDFTRANMMANIGIWDMKTYTYSQEASTYRNTGSSYPSSTTTYTSPDGYSGVLERTSTSNSPYSRDEGNYVKVTDSKTATDSCSSSVTTYYDSKGKYQSSSSWSNCPSSMSYSSDGYSGSLSRTGESTSGKCPNTGSPNGSCSASWTAYYSGTVYRIRDEWVPKMVQYDDYTGYYKGTIYKDVRQPYDASFMKAVKNKVVVYMTDQTISELNDLKMVLDKHDATLLLVGKDTIQKQMTHNGFIVNEGAIEDVMAELIAHIAKNNPAVPKTLLLVGQTAKTYTAYFDYEDDALPTEFDQLQIVQDPDYYDNSTGFMTFNKQSLIAVKDIQNWHPYQSEIALTKTGKYTFYRKVKDQPSTDPKLANFNYESNEAAVEVMVHRRPIADVILDFDYLTDANMYKTIWIDTSYDLDHNITRAKTDRGIQDRTLRFTNKGTGEVFTKIPDRLPPGTYTLDYRVQDIEDEWSDPVRREYILPNAIPVQMKSNLKSSYSGFSVNSVPASEQLTAFDMWTRYPYSISLALTMGSHINKTVPYYTGKKINNDINWQNEVLTIPNTTPDGTYTFTIQGIGSVAGSKASQNYTVKVVTPINLKGQIDAKGEQGESGTKKVTSLVVNDTYEFVASTTKYPDAAYRANATTVTLFKGTSYQKIFNMTSTTKSSTGYGAKDWIYTHKIGSMPNGKYTIEWQSTTPNGNTETVRQIVEVVNNRPPTAAFTWEPQPVYEGDMVQFKSDVNDADKDKLTVKYELTSPTGRKTTYDYTFDAPYPTTAPRVKMTEVGKWTMKLMVSDEKAPPVSISKPIAVLPLTVSGFVHHTEKWNNHRIQYNLKTSGHKDSPRTYATFWAGEKLLLQALTTDTTTATVASRVEVESERIPKKVTLLPVNKNSWAFELWEESFAKWADGAVPVTFTAYYNNGTIKSTTVTIFIMGEAASIAGVHRLK
ncbi:Athe_2463 domain-containing protein [Paenibacillus yanchengensis]|uniref:Athe_2463 domain-containing protein n=1 Tax=Paenibacillus yanchengensis TaxID=2035833 RepID=A0ABW4YFF4_9BACL